MKRIAFPVEDDRGLNGHMSQHFGHASHFLAVDIDEKTKDVKGTKLLQNAPHSTGGCMVPVNLLASNDVDIIVVGGIGGRPLMGFMEMGITVLNGNGHGTIGEIIQGLDKLEALTRSSCSGH